MASVTTTWSMSSLKSSLPSISKSNPSIRCSFRPPNATRFRPNSKPVLGSFLGLAPLHPLLSLTSDVIFWLKLCGFPQFHVFPIFMCVECWNSRVYLNEGLDEDSDSIYRRWMGLRVAKRVVGLIMTRKAVPKLNRPPDQRKALLRGLTTQLLKHGRIKTTRARASAVRKYVDKMITLAKEGSLHKRRQALGFIYEKQIVHALFAEVPERYGERNGGYTRIIRTLPRRGDNAPMAYIELV
ncbi:hypothetical protein OSB04_001142 [Centaurea solstitialis]|uniref:Large ribosomal subunit protein bL17c n=1 Tax=Centaurea solstitialis TaxID=347529 RepID=A0AA38WUU1_9ASTR|nr:hypothetical protein OSB04_001142 [Centaurea solstitialis]